MCAARPALQNEDSRLALGYYEAMFAEAEEVGESRQLRRAGR